MKKVNKLSVLIVSLPIILIYLFTNFTKFQFSDHDKNFEQDSKWVVDFFDDFDSFNNDNWQDQRLWVNNEKQCYVPDNQYGTRVVSDGTLKIKVIYYFYS